MGKRSVRIPKSITPLLHHCRGCWPRTWPGRSGRKGTGATNGTHSGELLSQSLCRATASAVGCGPGHGDLAGKEHMQHVEESSRNKLPLPVASKLFTDTGLVTHIYITHTHFTVRVWEIGYERTVRVCKTRRMASAACTLQSQSPWCCATASGVGCGPGQGDPAGKNSGCV